MKAGELKESFAGTRERVRKGSSWRHPLRSIDIGDYHDAFLISAVATIILVRLQLWVTNYPMLGGGNLHIAHLLYGGVLMVIAITFLISTVGRRPTLPGAAIGGIGLGLFIDEVGKFVTKDNDYFFEPTATIIYVTFIVLYLALRYVRNRVGFSQAEHLANALELLGAGADGHLTDADRRRALHELELAGDHPMAAGLTEVANAAPVAEPEEPSIPQRVAARARGFYYRQASRPGFPRFVGIVFAIWTFLNTVGVLILLLAGLNIGDVRVAFEDDSFDHLNVANWATLISSAATIGFALYGFFRLRHKDRIGGYTAFERALLVNLFVTHIFSFAESSFSATTGFLIALALFFTIRYMLARERKRGSADPGVPEAMVEAAPA